jgi:hypothetical protein
VSGERKKNRDDEQLLDDQDDEDFDAPFAILGGDTELEIPSKESESGCPIEEDSDLIQLSDDEFDLCTRRVKQCHTCIDDTASDESCQRVQLEKCREPGMMEMTYLTSAKPTPTELIDLMKQSHPHLNRAKIVSATYVSENKVRFAVAGTDRTSFLGGGEKFTWVHKYKRDISIR